MRVIISIKTLQLVVLIWTLVNGSLGGYNLRFIHDQMNCTSAIDVCKNRLGYDGLAILDTPDVYHYALRLSKPLRDIKGLWIGLTFDFDNAAWVWSNNRKVAKDAPLQDSEPQHPNENCGIVRGTRGNCLLAHHLCYLNKPAICGNSKQRYNEDIFKVQMSKKPTSYQNFSIIYNSRSLIECGECCLKDVDCRLAVYQSENATCTTSPALNPDLVDDEKSVTLIRGYNTSFCT